MITNALKVTAVIPPSPSPSVSPFVKWIALISDDVLIVGGRRGEWGRVTLSKRGVKV